MAFKDKEKVPVDLFVSFKRGILDQFMNLCGMSEIQIWILQVWQSL